MLGLHNHGPGHGVLVGKRLRDRVHRPTGPSRGVEYLEPFLRRAPRKDPIEDRKQFVGAFGDGRLFPCRADCHSRARRRRIGIVGAAIAPDLCTLRTTMRAWAPTSTC
jgi:hypothetical protein